MKRKCFLHRGFSPVMYILTQDDHHQKKTWEDEYNEFIEKYGFVVFKDKD
ncbi:MAG: hypothetical protein K0B11_18995 [Mariniphaga sp.]|nr:hypothetical protein [Mariniphaga sp.]